MIIVNKIEDKENVKYLEEYLFAIVDEKQSIVHLHDNVQMFFDHQ